MKDVIKARAGDELAGMSFITLAEYFLLADGIPSEAAYAELEGELNLKQAAKMKVKNLRY